MQVFDRATTGMHWQKHKDGAGQARGYEREGRRMEVAVAIGADPATVFSAIAPLPPGVSEFLFAGFVRGEAVPLVAAKTVDLLVPAEAEIVLEGYVDPGERRREGPFGDHTGFYSLDDDFPVFHVTALTRREKPVYLTTIVGRPPMEDGFMGEAVERLFLPLVKKTIPEIVDMHLPVEGIFHNLMIVSIDKRFPGHARKTMHAIWGTGQMMFTKTIVVVDRDVDVRNLGEVTWRALDRHRPGARRRDGPRARGRARLRRAPSVLRDQDGDRRDAQVEGGGVLGPLAGRDRDVRRREGEGRPALAEPGHPDAARRTEAAGCKIPRLAMKVLLVEPRRVLARRAPTRLRGTGLRGPGVRDPGRGGIGSCGVRSGRRRGGRRRAGRRPGALPAASPRFRSAALRLRSRGRRRARPRRRGRGRRRGRLPLAAGLRGAGGPAPAPRRRTRREREERSETTRVELARAQLRDALPGRSRRWLDTLAALERAAAGGASVLMTGESGTEKDDAALALHRLSPRGAGRFAYISEGESLDLATRQTAAGTLFLSNVETASIGFQELLLAHLESGRPTRFVVGLDEDPADALAAGRLLRGLHVALGESIVHLPPLREREGDVAILAESLLEAMEPGLSFEADALDVLRAHDWPGQRHRAPRGGAPGGAPLRAHDRADRHAVRARPAAAAREAAPAARRRSFGSRSAIRSPTSSAA